MNNLLNFYFLDGWVSVSSPIGAGDSEEASLRERAPGDSGSGDGRLGERRF